MLKWPINREINFVAFAKHFICVLLQIQLFTRINNGQKEHDKIVVYEAKKTIIFTKVKSAKT